jgi:S1-C subfamily serine protease
MIHLDLCKFEIASYREFKVKRPEIEISFSPTAFLGVRDSVNRTVEGCEISQVIPNSGADRGGIKPGDVVRKINGQAVETFEDLRLHVAQHQPGDRLAVTVQRAGQEIELEIQLSSIDSEIIN